MCVTDWLTGSFQCHNVLFCHTRNCHHSLTTVVFYTTCTYCMYVTSFNQPYWSPVCFLSCYGALWTTECFKTAIIIEQLTNKWMTWFNGILKWWICSGMELRLSNTWGGMLISRLSPSVAGICFVYSYLKPTLRKNWYLHHIQERLVLSVKCQLVKVTTVVMILYNQHYIVQYLVFWVWNGNVRHFVLCYKLV